MSGELAPTLSISTFSRFAIGATAFTALLNAVMKTGTLSTLISRLTTLMATSGLAW